MSEAGRPPEGLASGPTGDGLEDGPTGGPLGGAVDPQLLEILVCPLTKGPLRYDRARGELISDRARLAYPIRDGIPVMLPEEARPLDPP